MSRYILVIENWHPYPKNELLNRHHMTRYKLKKIDRHIVMAYSALHRFPYALSKRRVELTIIRGDSDPGRPADPDAYWLSLLDALVWAKLLVDDSEEWCEHKFIATERGEVKATRI